MIAGAPRRALGKFAAGFVAVSVAAFLLWEYALREPYSRLVAAAFALTTRVLEVPVHVVDVRGTEIRFARGELVWGDRFGMTAVGCVALTGLVLATWTMPWRRRLMRLAGGLAILFALHVLGLWVDVLHAHWKEDATKLPFADALHVFWFGFGTFLFPIALWLLLVHADLRALMRDGSAPSKGPPAAGRGSASGSPTGNRTPV